MLENEETAGNIYWLDLSENQILDLLLRLIIMKKINEGKALREAKMQSYWAFQKRDDNSWDLIEEEKFDELQGVVVAGSLYVIDEENRAKALEKIVGVGETIRRIFNDVNRIGNKEAYHKWFGGRCTANIIGSTKYS